MKDNLAEEYIKYRYGNNGSVVSQENNGGSGDTGNSGVDGTVGTPIVQDRSLMPTAPQDTGEQDFSVLAKKPNKGTDFLTGIAGDSWALTPEQEQARMRRMRTASAIGNLGNVMSAFANLYYVNKGAPSQKVPDAVVPPYMQFVDRVNQARRNAETMQMQRERLMADTEYKKEQLRLKEEAERSKQAWNQARIDKLVKEGDLTELKAEKTRQEIELNAETNPLKIQQLKTNIQNLEASIQQKQAAANNSNASAEKNMALADAARNGKETTVTRTDGFGRTTTTKTFQKPATRQSGNSGRTGNTGSGKKKINW